MTVLAALLYFQAACVAFRIWMWPAKIGKEPRVARGKKRTGPWTPAEVVGAVIAEALVLALLIWAARTVS